MRKFYFTLCLMAVMGSLMAGPVDQQKAQKLGAKFLSTTAISQKNANIQLDLVSVAADRDATDYYVFNVSNGEGFVVIAGDDRVRPILAYSTTGKYNPNDVADGFQYTLDGFRKEIQYVREHNLSTTPDIEAEWRSVNETGSLNRGGQTRAVVEPLCQTIWNQNYPWNSQCPPCVDTLGNGGHVFAGCAATAMGQVMKFWDWPAVGNSSHSYNPDGFDPQTANFGETEYHFEMMPLALDSTSSEEEIYYVSQLLYHLGIALDMQYSAVGSGANALSVYTAFQSYFRYSRDFPQVNAGDLIPGYGYTNEEWAQMLKDGGLDEHLPVFYTGSDDGGAGGHAFVCDGYDENDYFHFNWGWSGRDDAWCTIGALHTTRYDFNQTNMFIGHIVPENNEYFSRPDSVSKMAVLEEAFDAARLTWTNPTTDLNGNTLTDITSVTIRRNFEEIAVLTDVEAGADMEYIDNGLEPGLYEYSIYITNEAGISRTTYRSILVGEKCNIVFQMHDNGGDGWKGASISIADENFNRLAVVTMTQGSALVVDLPLLTGNLNFIWNSGWYHAYPEYDTDSECSFTIINAQGQTIYTSTGLEEGVFLTYDPCDFDAIDETVVDNGVSVYPNPTNGLLNVNGCGTMRITVSNMLGQTLFETTAEDNTTLDLSSYGQGFYLVRIATENGVMVQKINVRK
ncbi:MAG: C10 family peptidase [Bacteroidales bacterium]|nr:C10 family peptidase [Bacteroidales bacterium]